ncbi:MAG: hypothetical protein HN553_06130 [Opitutae bacterium]|nr:hypothetical protein [Opitutae bacterium]
MNVSSGIQAKGSTVPQPRHQAIGRNGSFWIPEDSSELSKHPKPVAQKSSKTNFESPKQTSNTQGNLKANAVSDKLKQNENFEKTLLSSKKINLTKPQVKTVPKSIVGKSLSSAKAKSSSLISNQSKTVKTLVLEGRTSISNPTIKDYKPPPILQNYGKNLPWHEDSGEHPQGNKKRNGGTNNASKVTIVEVEDKINSKFSSLVNSNDIIKNDSTAVAKFVDFVAKSVFPRLGYLNRFEKKVLRFAIDLPSGEKLGVRLEKSKDGVSVCFIAPNSEIRELLTSCKAHISDNICSHNAPKLKINIFADYAEMDNFFSLAA